MRYTVPCSLALESASLLMPEAITQIESAIRTTSKLAIAVFTERISTAKKSELFPTLNKEVMPKLTVEQDSLVPAEMTLRKQANEMSNQHLVIFCGNTMRGGTVDYCLDKVYSSVVNILLKLEDCLKSRLDHLTIDRLFTAITSVLDNKSYSVKTCEELHVSVITIVHHFETILKVNGFKEGRISMFNFILVVFA